MSVKKGKKKERRIVFSGDLGRPERPVLRDPVQPFNVDYLVLESTYGTRLHNDLLPLDNFARVINESVEREGVLLIPAFAVGRTQTLLYVIRNAIRRMKNQTARGNPTLKGWGMLRAARFVRRNPQTVTS